MYQTKYNPETKTWTGLNCTQLYNPNITIGQALLSNLRRYPTKVLQISDDSGEILTAKQIEIKMVQIAKNLMKMGYNQNDVIGIMAKNDKNIAPLAFGVLTIGASINPLDASFSKNEITHMYSLTKPSLVFCDGDILGTVEEALNEINLNVEIITIYKKVDGYKFIEEFFEDPDQYDVETFVPPNLENGYKRPGFILCSSGTTGPSKGVLISHAQVLNKFDLGLLTAEDIYLCFSSLYWLTGAASMVFGTLTLCTRIITRERFNPEFMFKLIEKYSITSVMTPPYQLALALQSPDIHLFDLSTLKRYLSGGASLPIYHNNEMNRKLSNGMVYCGYGMTECGGFISLNQCKEKLGSVGLLAPNAEVLVVDNDGNALGPDEDGEFLIRFPYKFLGYSGNPESSADTVDSDNWIHSGDIGHFDQDGYMFIVDRKKDIMKYLGYQISPSEIEDVIINYFKIASVCVVGIPDSELLSDLPAAVIIRPKGKTFTEEDVYNVVADSLADFKKLRGGVYFVKSLPLTPSGKIQKRKALETAIEAYNNNKNNFDILKVQ